MDPSNTSVEKRRELPTDGKIVVEVYNYEYDEEFDDFIEIKDEKFVDAHDLMWEAAKNCSMTETLQIGRASCRERVSSPV